MLAQAGLYAIMGCMRDVRVRAQRTDAMFEPLVETVAVLQKYGIEVCGVAMRLAPAPDLQHKSGTGAKRNLPTLFSCRHMQGRVDGPLDTIAT